MISFSKIVCKDLKNVEIFGKNDPYCEIQLGPEGKKVKTNSQKNAGVNCTWVDKDLEIQDAGPFDAENPEADEGDAAEYAGMQISF